MFSVQCMNHNVETVLDLSDDMPKLVLGDSARVIQIFANLISNSIKFTSCKCNSSLPIMAVIENNGELRMNINNSNRNMIEATIAAPPDSHHQNSSDLDDETKEEQQQQQNHHHLVGIGIGIGIVHEAAAFQMKVLQPNSNRNNNKASPPPLDKGNGHKQGGGGSYAQSNSDLSDEGFNRDMKDLEELLSKLNPMAQEFVPPSLGITHSPAAAAFFHNNSMMLNNITTANGNANGRRKKNNFSQGKRRMNSRTNLAQREEVIRRTVYVSDIDHQVTEEQLAALFINCGQFTDEGIDMQAVVYNLLKGSLKQNLTQLRWREG